MTGPVGIRRQRATNQVSGVLGETSTDRISVPHAETRQRLVANPEEITHSVCCCDVSRRVAFGCSSHRGVGRRRAAAPDEAANEGGRGRAEDGEQHHRAE